MQLRFLGGANTVTGSRFLLTTERARVLIDCGMFQGSPNEVIRNRVPLGFDPSECDAILITHAHLDHCGLLPVVVREGYSGPIYLTSATAELVEIVLLDSGRLQEEFAKRHDRWERRHPEKAEAADAQTEEKYRAAADQARRAEEAGHVPTSMEPDAGAAANPAVANADATAAAANAAPAAESEATAAAEDSPPAASSEGNPESALRAQPPSIDMDLDDPLYDESDAEKVMPLFKHVRYGRPMDVAPGIRATFFDAGHILGSAIISLEIREHDGAEPRTIVFSGDLGRPDTPIISDPTPMANADYVVVESTYGGREHEPGDEAVRMLAEVVNAVDKAGGVLLIPSFAIGRTQEIVWELDRLIERGEIPQLPLYLDSPMATRASDVYRRHPEFYDAETADLLKRGETPLDYPDQHITRRVDESKAIATAQRPYMIVASNGMLTGGRVVAHLRNLIDDPAATILFVGYQGEGTLGAHLQAGATTVKVDGQVRNVRCKVRSISGFSAHADESELLDWLGHFAAGKGSDDAGYPRTVFLVHGDPEAQIAIQPKVEALGFRVHVPHWREAVTLD
ncbi:MAG TPA: MBL fold metallo-hydrolase [Candidatus Limnocylindria bacterium]|nr:MBL fold metallo-hydrolase [Candidatus Limnocylindria bacterium]